MASHTPNTHERHFETALTAVANQIRDELNAGVLVEGLQQFVGTPRLEELAELAELELDMAIDWLAFACRPAVGEPSLAEILAGKGSALPAAARMPLLAWSQAAPGWFTVLEVGPESVRLARRPDDAERLVLARKTGPAPATTCCTGSGGPGCWTAGLWLRSTGRPSGRCRSACSSGVLPRSPPGPAGSRWPRF